MSRASFAALALVAIGLAACAGGEPEADSSALLNTEPMQPSPSTTPTREPSAAPAPPAVSTPSFAHVPAGTILAVRLATSLNSGTAAAGDLFHAEVVAPISVGDIVAIPAGSRIHGIVDEVHAAKRGAGHGSMTLRFHRMELPSGDEVEIQAGLSQETDGKKKRNAAIIGGSAAGGALLGRVLGDDSKDAAIGAVVGGAIGTGVVLSKKGDQVDLPAGTELALELEATVPVPVPADLS